MMNLYRTKWQLWLTLTALILGSCSTGELANEGVDTGECVDRGYVNTDCRTIVVSEQGFPVIGSDQQDIDDGKVICRLAPGARLYVNPIWIELPAGYTHVEFPEAACSENLDVGNQYSYGGGIMHGAVREADMRTGQ
jgi:hypothetical protein